MNATLRKILVWIPSHLGVLLLGAGILLFVWYLPLRANDSKLKSELKSVQQSLAHAKVASGQLAQSNQQLQRELTSANTIVANQGQKLADQQRIIDSQRGDIAATESGLANLAQSVTSAGGTIENTARTIAKLVDGLYSIYFKGSTAG